MIQQHIKRKVVGFKHLHFYLEEENNRIVVIAPCLCKEDENSKRITVRNIIFEIENGHKADFVREFFACKSSGVVDKEGYAYHLEDVLFDEVEIPEKERYR